MRAIKTSIISILVLGLLAGSAVGVAAQDEEAADPMAPATFKWFLGDPPGEFLEPTVTTTDYGESESGSGLVDFIIEAGDPRASGLYTSVGNQNKFTSARSGVRRLWTRIVNDDGAWSGTGTVVQRFKKNPNKGIPVGHLVRLSVLEGEGAYEGLTLILTSTLEDDRGYIFPTDLLPPVPELPAEPPAE